MNLDRVFRNTCWLLALLAANCLFFGECGTALGEDPVTATVQVLRRELAGEDTAREADLRAIADNALAPPLAHWSLGEVSLGTGWVLSRDYLATTGRAGTLAKYRAERDSRTGTFADHLALADLCRSLNLPDEEQAHLIQAVRVQWQNPELHNRLGQIRLGGFWFALDDLQRAAQRQETSQARLAHWRSPISRIAAQLLDPSPAVRRRGQNQLQSIRTPDAIGAMEAALADGGPSAHQLLISWLSGVDSYEAAQSLARMAIAAPLTETRVAAQRALREERWDEFVPWLLAGLETSQQTAFDIRIDPGLMTRLRAVKTVVIQGETVDYALTSHREFATTRLGEGVSLAPGTMNVEFRMRRGNGINPSNDLVHVLQALSREQLAAEWQQASQQQRNDRILRTLQSSTQVEGNRKAEDWWGWWRSVNDIELTGEKLKLQDGYEEDYAYYQGQLSPVQQITFSISASCFSGETVVETESGPRRIDSVRIGDRVLAQDVESGRLDFRPVWTTTVRQNARLLRIRTPDETILCSVGHPFWVSGQGWRMARELQPDMILHTLSGGVRVEAIEPAGTGPVYNLISGQAHTYFAGTSRFFTHDVTPREPSDMVLPGVRKEF